MLLSLNIYQFPFATRQKLFKSIKMQSCFVSLYVLLMLWRSSAENTFSKILQNFKVTLVPDSVPHSMLLTKFQNFAILLNKGLRHRCFRF